MLSMKFIRGNPDKVKTAIKHKYTDVDLDQILALDDRRRIIIGEVEELKARKNRASAEISAKKRERKDAQTEISAMRTLSGNIKELDQSLKDIELELNKLLLYVPNVLDDSVPHGKDDSANELLREWGQKPEYTFNLKDQLEIGTALKLFDLKRGAKIAGTGFPLYTGLGARLERALLHFMLEFHLEHHGYQEIIPPFLSNRQSPQTTGQLPKFADDMYHSPEDDLFCIPTAEVPVTNIHRAEILPEEQLPIKYVAHSACFRREAGSYGKDTRGLLRLHQFNKIELVKFVKPENSHAELELLLNNAEAVLQALGLHYRVVVLSSGDLSFSATKCYDLEVWAPATGKYLEVSSCSNFEDFQARRGQIRYRSKSDQKVQFVHTLNGSGVATPRLMAALLETYQQADGSVKVPAVLQSFMKTDLLT